MQHLTALPNRNNAQFILDYVREQRQYRHIYAAAGLLDSKSWHISEEASTTHVSESVVSSHRDLLNTPILRARSRKPLENSTKVARLRQEDQGPQKQRETTGPQCVPALSPEKCTVAHPKENHVAGVSSRKPQARKYSSHEKSSSDGAHGNRLEERRLRKKAKKDIMQPEGKTPGDRAHQKGSKKQKKKESNMQAGFALMHGFSATNVGKNRLTLDHISMALNKGVFKKGKASDAAKVKSGRAGYFEEAEFLNTSRDKSSRRSHPRSSSSSSRSSSKHADKQTEGKLTVKHKNRKIHERSPDPEPSEIATLPGKTVRHKYNPEDSVVWDIEKSGPESDRESSPRKRQGTILVSFPVPVNRKQKTVEDLDSVSVVAPASFVEGIKEAFRTGQPPPASSAISLGPSQSASQVLIQSAIPIQKTTSSYFPAARSLAEKEPVNDPVDPKNELSLAQHPDAEGLHGSGYLAKPVHHLPEEPARLGFSVLADDEYALHLTSPPVDCLGSFAIAEPPALLSQTPSYWSEVNWFELDAYHTDEFDEHDAIGMEDTTIPFQTSAENLSDLSFDVSHIHGHFSGSAHIWREDILPYMHFDSQPNQPHDLVECTQYSGYISPDASADSPEYADVDCHYQPELFYPDQAFEDIDDGIRPASSYSDEHMCTDLSEDVVPSESVHFYQGRSLLQGFSDLPGQPVVFSGIQNAEAEVAGLLKKTHWLPQKL